MIPLWIPELISLLIAGAILIPQEAFEAVGEIIRASYNSLNWAARWVFRILLGYPVLVTVLAAYGKYNYIYYTNIAFLITLAFLFIAGILPIFIIHNFRRGYLVLAGLATMIAADLGLGLAVKYFHFDLHPGSAVVFITLVVMFVLLAYARQRRFAGVALTAMVALLMFTTGTLTTLNHKRRVATNEVTQRYVFTNDAAGKAPLVARLLPSAVGAEVGEVKVIGPGKTVVFHRPANSWLWSVEPTIRESDCCLHYDLEYAIGAPDKDKPSTFDPNKNRKPGQQYRFVTTIAVSNKSRMEFAVNEIRVPNP